jgi:hypothetical protein
LSSPKTSIEDLELSGGGPNLSRALRRKRSEESRELTDDARAEISKLDELISDALEACHDGHTVGSAMKANPAFQNLRHLVTVREMLKKGVAPPKKSGRQLLNEMDALLNEDVN